MATEKSPLLGSQSQGDLSDYGDGGTSQDVYVPPITPEQLPPPYSSLGNGSQMIACKVCSSMIDISGKTNQHIVKCSNCNEATPIKNAPPGKKYVRCPCNCLLICRADSKRVSCPRNECKNIIDLQRSTDILTPTVPGICQVTCAHCPNLFTFNTLNNSLAMCPHCKKISSVGIYFARRRAYLFLMITLTITIIAAIVIGTSYHLAAKSGGYYVLFIGLPIVALIFLIQFIRFFTMKVSTIVGPVQDDSFTHGDMYR